MMANKRNHSGTMTFPSCTAVALWNNEVCGQISDGMWENASPRDHYKFWCRLTVTVGPEAKLDADGWAAKATYSLTRLHQLKWDDGSYVLRDRMLACGRLARAGVDPSDTKALHAAEYMPASIEDFRLAKFTNKWQHDFIADYMASITDEIAVRYYAATYTLKDLNADLKLIMQVMRTARP